MLIRKKKDDYDDDGTTDIRHSFKDIIINAIPIAPIEIIHDPLFGKTKYRIRWEWVGACNRIERTRPEDAEKLLLTKTELRDWLLRETNFVYKHRLLDDTLTQVLKAYQRTPGMAVVKEEIEPEGFFLLNGKVVASKLNIIGETAVAGVSEAEDDDDSRRKAREAVNALLELQRRFFVTDRDKARLAYYVKLLLVGPFDYVRKQLGIAQIGNWIPRGDLIGRGRNWQVRVWQTRLLHLEAKSNTHIIPKRNVDSEARCDQHTRLDHDDTNI